MNVFHVQHMFSGTTLDLNPLPGRERNKRGRRFAGELKKMDVLFARRKATRLREHSFCWVFLLLVDVFWILLFELYLSCLHCGSNALAFPERSPSEECQLA